MAFQGRRCVILALDGLGRPSYKTFPDSAKVLQNRKPVLIPDTETPQSPCRNFRKEADYEAFERILSEGLDPVKVAAGTPNVTPMVAMLTASGGR